MSHRVQAKLLKRGITWSDVEEATCCTWVESARVEEHRVHGRRLVVVGRTYAGHRLKVHLTPGDWLDEDEPAEWIDPSEGTWTCKTAWWV